MTLITNIEDKNQIMPQQLQWDNMYIEVNFHNTKMLVLFTQMRIV